MNGLDRIQQTFKVARSQGRAALMPYFTLGFPTPEVSLQIVEAIARSGADLIELGLPFSDPLADGPTIQRSTQVALANGMTIARCLDMVVSLRSCGVVQPLLLMGYYNPILAYGLQRFAAQAAQAGADGLIVPDLPPEEAGELESACQSHGLGMIYLLPPTATPERTTQVLAHTTGFVYLVSLTGVTGARDHLPEDLGYFVEKVRLSTQLPLAVGFGISTPEQASSVGRTADGVIVGSALIKAVEGAGQPILAAVEFVQALQQGLENSRVNETRS